MLGYSAFRIFEETLRIDSSEHFLGLRLNFYIATILAIIGLVWFIVSQRRKGDVPPAEPSESIPTTATEPYPAVSQHGGPFPAGHCQRRARSPRRARQPAQAA